MYSNDQACIKIGDKITDSFETNQGIKQGCILIVQGNRAR